MRGLIVTSAAAVILLAVVAAAGAETPAGFWRSARLAPAASFVAGKPVAVYCAKTQAAIDATVSATATNTLGSTFPGGDDIDLAPVTCSYLDAWLNGRKVANLYGVAVSMETLAHEAALASGIADETTATCIGLKKMPKMVTKFFPLKKRESLHDLMGDAYNAWATQSSVYHAHPC